MEKIGKNDFIDIYVLKTLNEIKGIVKHEIKLEKEREMEIDKKMAIVLKDLINANFKNLQMNPNGDMIYTLLPIVDDKENEKIRLSFALYYAALYYDNVSLLHDLLKENIRFDDITYHINLQYLNKEISSKFERTEYIKMIKTCGNIFRRFIDSIEELPEEERKKYIDRFVKLINIKYDLISEMMSEKSELLLYFFNNLEYIFDKCNLDIFTDETYIRANKEQLRLIQQCKGKSYLKETKTRLNNLMQNKDFSKYLCNFDLMMRLYTDEQLETLNYYTSEALDKFSGTEESLNKAIDFLQMRPDLAKSLTNVASSKDFMSVDNFTLIEICTHSMKMCPIKMNFDIEAKIVKPKVLLKKIFGTYTKREN